MMARSVRRQRSWFGARITTLPSPTTLADRINPVFQRLDIGDEFTGLRHRRARRCGLIVAGTAFSSISSSPYRPPGNPRCDGTGFTEDAVTSMLFSVIAARGVLTEAEFSAKKAELLDRL
jgi:hypothetical protein